MVILDRIATHILSFEGDGSVVYFDGNYPEDEPDRTSGWVLRRMCRSGSIKMQATNTGVASAGIENFLGQGR